MDCSTPGFPVLHHLLEFAQTHVRWVSDAIQHLLSSPSPPAFNLSQHQGLFWWVSSLHQVAKGLEFQLNPTLKPLNCCCKSHQILPDGHTQFWGAGTHRVSPFAWQSTEVILFYFTQNSVSKMQFSTSAQRLSFQPPWGDIGRILTVEWSCRRRKKLSSILLCSSGRSKN